MATTPKELLDGALKLPESERAALAARLIDSLESEADEGTADAWEKEIRRRLEEIDSGAVQMISWSEARRMIDGIA